MKWTVGLALAFGLLAYWDASGHREAYFLRKSVVEHPRDASAWLELAHYYSYEGDKLAADSGDEDHAAPDPTPSYREALVCLDQVISLGTRGFDVYLARAQLADKLGEHQEAVSSGREALNLALVSIGSSSDREEDEVKWLQDMVSRNAAEPPKNPLEGQRKRVRDQRRERLPGVVRWVFEVF